MLSYWDAEAEVATNRLCPLFFAEKSLRNLPIWALVH